MNYSILESDWLFPANFCHKIRWTAQVFDCTCSSPENVFIAGQIGTASGRSIGAITHWSCRSICRGSHSLLERLTELGKSNKVQIQIKNVLAWNEFFLFSMFFFPSVGDPSKYISFYGLRTHSEIHGAPVSELYLPFRLSTIVMKSSVFYLPLFVWL